MIQQIGHTPPRQAEPDNDDVTTQVLPGFRRQCWYHAEPGSVRPINRLVEPDLPIAINGPIRLTG